MINLVILYGCLCYDQEFTMSCQYKVKRMHVYYLNEDKGKKSIGRCECHLI